jgi:hypothetical protein
MTWVDGGSVPRPAVRFSKRRAGVGAKRGGVLAAVGHFGRRRAGRLT